MVAPFTDLQDGDAENLIYLVFSGIIARRTLPASLLISMHSASRAGRLLAITKMSSAYPQICVSVVARQDKHKNIPCGTTTPLGRPCRMGVPERGEGNKRTTASTNSLLQPFP